MSAGNYSISLDEKNGLVRATARGELTKELGEKIITEARTLAAEYQYLIYFDVRDSEAKVSLADWFYLPRKLSVFKQEGMRAMKVAVLISPGKHERSYSFYQTVSSNLGFNLRIFLKEADALAWLLNPKTAPE